ncbi:hypothetical protein SBA5_760022 [Candidatus Sulfotelmatomonas gaucii]|uniref:Uncharacterized protein n=1 Tax=Candidatus Sulfuritelmatomonas gaucii TaxID=2043161 RepID=A0A2N9M3X2_9BACT|nr:hypothetical protein SBA5_760022 [Candidatus Sulfotelmatomonas gaucii]
MLAQVARGGNDGDGKVNGNAQPRGRLAMPLQFQVKPHDVSVGLLVVKNLGPFDIRARLDVAAQLVRNFQRGPSFFQ